MAKLKNIMRVFALGLVRGSCACACLLPLSCAFGDADAVQSLFEDNGDPLFVTAGMDSSGNYALYSSPTGTIWTGNLVQAAEPGILNCVIYGNGLFLSAGTSPNYYMSTDGLLWGKGSTGGGDTIYDGACGNGRYVVVGANSAGEAMAYASEDGIVWISTSLRLKFPGMALYGITYASGMFVAVGTNGLVVTSADGIAWSGNLGPALAAMNLYDVACGNGLFVAVGSGGVATASLDGLAWSKVFYIGKDFVDINGITCGGGRFVAVGNVTGTGYSGIYVSDDGLAWSANINSGSGGYASLQDVAYCHGYFVAVSSNGIAAYSPQGLSWERKPVAGSMTLYGITCRP